MLSRIRTSSKAHLLWALGVVLFAVLFQAASSPAPKRDLGFTAVTWKESPTCEVMGTSAAGTCFSEPLRGRGSTLIVWLRGIVTTPAGQGVVLRHADSLMPVQTLYLMSRDDIGKSGFRAYHFDVPADGAPFVLQLFDETEGTIRARNRVDFFAPDPSTEWFFAAAGSLPGKVLIALFGAFLFASALRHPRFKSAPLPLVCAAATLILFYRYPLYYYYDEWHAVAKFAKDGFKESLKTHNEHFLPLFFLFYQLEILIFRSWYWVLLIISALIHGLNCLLLRELLCKLSMLVNRRPSPASHYLAFLFGISALHLEVLQWAFEQSILMSFTCTLSLLLLSLGFLENRRLVLLPGVFLLSAACPLTFGNGFVVFGVLVLLTALYEIEHRSRRWGVIAAVNGASAAGFALAAGLYKVFVPPGAGHMDLNLVKLSDVVNYIFVGTQLGTVLRGLSLFPSLDIKAAQMVVPEFFIGTLSAEVIVALAGFIVSIAIFVASVLLTKQMRACTILWLFGSVWAAAAFVLPAVARVQWGVFQSLSLRYQYLTLGGLAVLICPLADWLVTQGHSMWKRKALLAYFTVQLLIISNYSYFSLLGESTRAFLYTLESWKTAPELAKAQGLYPEFAETISPGKTTAKIAPVVEWLNLRQSRLHSESR